MSFSEAETIELVAGIDGMGRDAAEKIVYKLGPMPHGDGLIGTGDSRYRYCVRARQLFEEVS